MTAIHENTHKEEEDLKREKWIAEKEVFEIY